MICGRGRAAGPSQKGAGWPGNAYSCWPVRSAAPYASEKLILLFF